MINRIFKTYNEKIRPKLIDWVEDDSGQWLFDFVSAIKKGLNFYVQLLLTIFMLNLLIAAHDPVMQQLSVNEFINQSIESSINLVATMVFVVLDVWGVFKIIQLVIKEKN
jgi:hypothetical protein